jgi:starch synthase
MAKQLSVLLVTAEVYPFLKTSELGDIVYAHSLGTREVGHDMRVMMLKYGFLSERKNRIHDINRLKDIPIPVGSETSLATVKSSSINNARVKVQSYITTNANYLDAKKGVLHDNTSGKEFTNNDERFIFYNRTVLETCKLLGWFPDIIHCMGWQAGLVPALVRTEYAAEFKKTKLVYTITDFEQQGVFPAKSIAKTGLHAEGQKAATLAGQLNMTKLGISYADAVTTLSPSYAAEIEASKEFKTTWKKILANKPLIGIPHGIDLLQWTSKADAFVRPKFDSEDTSNKSAARELLQKNLNLTVDGSKFVAAFVGPLTEARGADLLATVIPDLVKNDIQVVVGTDIPTSLSKMFAATAKKYPSMVAVVTGLDEEQLHAMIAGATVWLKPSRHEPAGQFQRAALVYGTIPVVRITGGVADALIDVDATKGTGNAFLFKKPDAAELLKTILKAQKVFHQHERWQKIVTNAMKTPVGWALSALPYDELYRALAKDIK